MIAPPHKNIRLLNIYVISLSFIPLIGVIVPFYQNQLGLSFQEFLMVEAIFAATIVLMEVPSGWLSDIWKRKYVLALAGGLTGFAFVLLGMADNIWEAIAAEVLIGIGVSLASGTSSALLYDTMLEEGSEAHYRKAEGKRHGLGFYSIGLASMIGGFLYAYDPYLPIWITAATYFLCVPIALLMVEPERYKEPVRKNPFRDMATVMKFALHGQREVAALIFFVAIFYGSTKTGMWLQQPYYLALDIPEMWFGVFASVGFLVGGMGSHMGHFLERFMRPIHILIALWAIAILCWMLSGGYLGYHALALLMISNAAWGIGFPVMQDAINKRVDSSRRATVLSVASLMTSLTFIPLGIGIGWVVDAYGVQAGLLALAGFVLFANIWNVRRLL